MTRNKNTFDQGKVDQIRALYTEGKSYNELAKQFDCSKSSISKYCKDIVRSHKERQKIRQDGTQTYVSPNRRLTDNVVAHMRRECRRLGYSDLGWWAKELSITRHTVSAALRGVFYPSANELEPPLDKIIRKPFAPRKVEGVSEATIMEMVALRREDPAKWSYQALVDWMFSKTGRRFRPNRLGDFVRRRAPELKHVKVVRPRKAAVRRKRISIGRDLLLDLVDRRHTNPARWSYKQLGEWMSEKTGKKYGAAHIKRLLVNHDPDIVKLEAKDIKLARPKAKLTAEAKQKALIYKKDKRKQDRLALIRLLAAENDYEKAIAS